LELLAVVLLLLLGVQEVLDTAVVRTKAAVDEAEGTDCIAAAVAGKVVVVDTWVGLVVVQSP
jgi:hypothetical protein